MQKYLFGLFLIVGVSILSYPVTDISAAQLWTGLAAGQSTQVATLSGGQAATMYIVNNHPTLTQFVPYSDTNGTVYECEGSSWLHHIANWLVSMLPTMWSQSRGLSVSCAGVPPVVTPPEPPQNICGYTAGGGGHDRFYFNPIIGSGNKAYLTYEVQYYHPIYSGGWQTVRFIDNFNNTNYIRDSYGNGTSGTAVSNYSGLIDGTLPATGGFNCTTFTNGMNVVGVSCFRTSAFEYSSEVSFLPSTGKNALSGAYPSLWFNDLSQHSDGFAQPIRIRAYSGSVAQDRHICDLATEEGFWATNYNDVRHPSNPNQYPQWPVKGFHDNGRSVFKIPSIPGEVRIIHDEVVQVISGSNGPNTIDVIINSGLMIGNTWYELPINNIIPTFDISFSPMPGDGLNNPGFVCYGSGGSSWWNGKYMWSLAYDNDYNSPTDYIGDTFISLDDSTIMTGKVIDSAQPMYLICGYDKQLADGGMPSLPFEFTFIRKRIY